MARKFPMRKRPTNKTAAGISWRAGALQYKCAMPDKPALPRNSSSISIRMPGLKKSMWITFA